MTIIRPVSDLRNYPSVLEDLKDNGVVYLTKNGRGAYVIMEMAEFEEYTKERASVRLLSELNEAESSGYVSAEEMENHFKERMNDL